MSLVKRAPGSRVVFSLLMAVVLLLNMSPLTFAQDATPTAPQVPGETAVPVVEPTEVPTEAPTAIAIETPVDADTETPATIAPAPTVGADTGETAPGMAPQQAAFEAQATKDIFLTNTQPLRCETGYWLFTILPDPGEDVQSLHVTYTNGNTEVLDRGIGYNRANFRTSANRDSTVASAVAVVPAEFEPTAFQITAGPCNDEPVDGAYAVTIVAETSDDGSAEGAGVTISRNDGTEVTTGTIDAMNTFLAGELEDGGYTVAIDGWPADYNRVTTDFTVSNQDRSVNVSLTRMQPGWIEIEAGESNQAGGARIEGALVTITDQGGETVAQGETDERGKFRSDILDPSVYNVTVDGSAVGYTTIIRTVSNERGSNLTGVVLERLPEEAAVTIAAVTFDDGGAEGARVSVKDANSREILSGTLGPGNTFDAGILPNGKYSVTVDAWSLGLPYMYGFVHFTVNGQAVTVDVPLNDFPTKGSLSGTVRNAETGTGIAGVEVVVTGPDGDTYTDISSSTGWFRITRLTQGVELAISVNAEGYEPYTTTHTFPPTAGSQGKQMVIALQPIVTQEVTITAQTSDGGSAEGALVMVDDAEDITGIVPLAIDPVDGTLDTTNSFAAGELPPGEYTVLIDGSAQGYGVGEATFLVPSDGPVTVELTRIAANVTVNFASADRDIATTLPEDATWTLSINGGEVANGTFRAEYRTLPVTINADALVPFGEYTLAIDAGPAFEPYLATFTVNEAVEMFDVILAPVVPEPTTGYVFLYKYYCEDVDEVVFNGDNLGTDCFFGPATFTFYLIGDGTDAYEQIVVGETGINSIELTPGTYEVVEEVTLARTTIDVVAGEITDLEVQNPVEDDAGVPGDDDVPTPTVPAEPEDDDDAPADNDSATPVVTKLPSTGSGAADGSGLIAMAAVAATAIAGVGALSVRRNR